MNHHRAVPGSAHPTTPPRAKTRLLTASLVGTAIAGLVFALGPGPQLIVAAAGTTAGVTDATRQGTADGGEPGIIVARLGATIEFGRVSVTTAPKPEPTAATPTTFPQTVDVPEPAPAPVHVPPPVIAPPPTPIHGAPSSTPPRGPAAGHAFLRTGVFASPLPQLNLTSPFGHRINPLTQAPDEMHTGQDFGASCGTPVRAVAQGTVSFAGWHADGGGNRLVVDHGAGLQTTYNHLSAITVREGQKLARGQVAARVGTTGSSTGCHLHFEVLLRGTPVDPGPWL